MYKNQKKRFIFILFLLFTPFVTAYAGQGILHETKDDKGIFSFTLENDYFVGEDNGYTNGFLISYLSPEANIPEWLETASSYFPFFAKNGHKRYGLTFGQAMFAPDDLRRADLIEEDRPYAGFLYGSIGMLTDTGYRLDHLQLSIGMVGPSSVAEETQKFVHKVIDSIDPKGWNNQLKDELGIILTYERKWRGIYQLNPYGWGIDATPHIGASLGNIHTYAAAGITFRVGYDLPSDYGPPLIRPNLPGSDFFMPNDGLGWYLFAGLEGRAVARNIFLDGNTFKDSHSVEKNHFVGSLQAGIAVTYENIRIAYTHIFRTKEFKGQDNADEFGAITISYRF